MHAATLCDLIVLSVMQLAGLYIPVGGRPALPVRGGGGELACEVRVVEDVGSSRAVTRLHTMIRLTGYRSRDLLRIRRALYRLTEKA
jgi:hypothetical protein